MSGLDSWEDDPAAQDESLSRQTQQNLNLNGQARSFQPGAASFQPSAQSFQPGQPYQQYGGGAYNQYSQYQQQPQYGGNNYSQYGQQGYGQAYSQGYGQQNIYDPSYTTQYQNYQQQQSYQSQQSQSQQGQSRQTPVIAKRPTANENKAATATDETKADPTAAPKAKVLSIGDTSAPPKAKVLSIGDTSAAAPKAKVLSIGDTGAKPKEKEARTAEEQGSKVTATKAIEKTGEAKVEPNGKVSAPTSGKSSPTLGDPKARGEVDAVAKEQEKDVDDEILEEVYGKEHVNIIFIGHVDAGKSTLGGSILYATGMVDERTMDKYKKEARDAGRETWYLSWAVRQPTF